MIISMESDCFNVINNIANGRPKNSKRYRINLAEIGFTLQLAHVLGVAVSGLEKLEDQVKMANPHFSGWRLVSIEEYCRDLCFLDEMKVNPSRKFEEEFLKEVQEAKEYLDSLPIKANA